MDKDFEIQIKIAVYKPNGEYIKQCNNNAIVIATESIRKEHK